MVVGWIQKDNKWYHFGEKGAMNKGWLKDTDGNWYYLKNDGSMASNEYVDGYYLSYNGAWEKNK